MKKIIALALSVLMILTCFVGCKGKSNEDLANAVAYLENMYQTGSKDEPMVLGVDKDVLSVVTVDGVSYAVEWAVTVTEGASDAVKISESDTENCVKIDIPDMPEEDILFTATATVKDEKENAEVAEFSFKVKGIEVAVDVEQVLNDAYALEEGAKMEGEVTLTGKITSIDTPYDAGYKNVTVTIVIEGYDDKPIKCYRLAGEGADTLAVGDTITVTGIIANYKGTIEFEQGCAVKEIVKADGTTTSTPSGTTSTPSGTTSTPTTSTPTTSTPTTSTPTTSTPSGSGELKLVTDQAKILKDAFALGKNETTPYIAQLTGKAIDNAKPVNNKPGYSVTIQVDGKNILCYNMTGTGVDKVKAGDTITVRGVIKNFYYEDDTTGKVEFTWDQASQVEVIMVSRVAGTEVEKKLTIVDNPVVGTAYKFGFVSTDAQNAGTYYAVGGMDGYYMKTTTSSVAAIDVYLENATGGYYLYTMIDGKKQYMTLETSANKEHVNAVYKNTPGAVFKYDADKKTLVTTLSKKDKTTGEIVEAVYAFGTYSYYITIGSTDTSKTGYECHFYK